MRSNGNARPGLAARSHIAVWRRCARWPSPRAPAAATGGAPTPSGSPPPPAAPPAPRRPRPAPAPLTLVAAETDPRKSFYFGYRFPRLSFTIGSSQPQNDLRIDVVNAAGEVVRTFYREDVAPERRRHGSAGTGPRPKASRRATASTASGSPPRRRPRRPPARRPRRPRSASASPSTATPSRSSAPTNSASARGRFGAGRSGHTHQGQDVMAACGTPLVAARGGRVQYAGYEAQRRQLRRHRRQGHAATTSCTRTWPNPRRCRTGETSAPASRSGSSATPATPPPATCTSRSGARPAGTRAAPRSTHSPN